MKRHMIVLTLGTAFASTVLAEGNCPVLDTSTIADAACATVSKPYLPENGVKYIAETPCPSGLWRKKFQGLLGTKDYPPVEEKVIQEGSGACRYELQPSYEERWSKKRENLIFDVRLQTTLQADVWSSYAWRLRQPYFYVKRPCPFLAPEVFHRIKDGTFSEWFEPVFEPTAVYPSGHRVKFTETELKKQFQGGTWSAVKLGYVTKADSNRLERFRHMLSNYKTRDRVEMSATLTVPFKVECTYEIKPEGKPVTVRLLGSNGDFKRD